MERKLLGDVVRQKSTNEFLCATDLVRIGNKWRKENGMGSFNFSRWLGTQPVKEFTRELERQYGKIMIKGKGRRGSQTWVHPLLFIDLALSINPKLKVEMYKWLFDHLIRSRNNSGDSYKLMCGALYTKHNNPRTFPDFIQTVARQIREFCLVTDWQTANERQLQLRDKLHYDITLLAGSMTNNQIAVSTAFRLNSVACNLKPPIQG